MDDKQVKIVINGEDKSGAAFASAQKNAGGLSSQLGSLTKVIGGGLLAGGAALTAFLYSSGKAAADAEVSFTRMKQTVNNTFDAFKASKLNEIQAQVNKEFGDGTDIVDAYLGKIKESSNAAVKLGFDDESAAESIAKLFQRTGDLTKANELNNLSMDLARAKNIELADATNLVGQVLSGNGRILKQYGIEISDTLTPLQALDELHKQVGGNAEAFTQTFAGQMTVLGVEVDNLKETIGTALLNTIMPFMKQLTEWAAKPETQQKIKEISDAIQHWAGVVLPVAIDVIKMWVGWIKTAYDALVDFEVKILNTIDAIEKLYATMSKKISTTANSVGSAWANAPSNIAWALGIGGKASGGPVSGGMPYVVGEHGPELFMPSGSGSIVPNGGMGGMVINITGNTLLDGYAGEKIAAQLMSALKGNIRI